MTISLQNISLSYENYKIFDDFSHDFTAGKTHAILGRSGIGKTTLLRLIAGLITYQKGDIDINGDIAMMAQSDQLLPWCNVWDNIFIGFHLRGAEISNDMREKAINLLQQTALDDWCNAYPNALSGGMRQRIALIRTIMENAPIILLDEPLSACDTITKRELYPIIKQIFIDAPQTTIIMVCHDIYDAKNLGDFLWLLEKDSKNLITYHEKLAA